MERHVRLLSRYRASEFLEATYENAPKRLLGGRKRRQVSLIS
jgi:hypothetical protein